MATTRHVGRNAMASLCFFTKCVVAWPYSDGDHAREWGTFIQNLRVTFLDVLPSEIRSWRQSKCMSGLDWSSIKCFSVKNGQSVKDDMHWLMAFAGYKPVIESRDGLITGSLMQPQAPTACSTKVLGVNFKILDEMGRRLFWGSLC